MSKKRPVHSVILALFVAVVVVFANGAKTVETPSIEENVLLESPAKETHWIEAIKPGFIKNNFNWKKYQYSEDKQECVKQYYMAIEPFLSVFNFLLGFIQLRLSMIKISHESTPNKYILDFSEDETIQKLLIMMPNSNNIDIEKEKRSKEEDTFAQLLFSTLEITGVDSVHIYLSSQNLNRAADIHLLASLISKLRACKHLVLANIENISSGKKYLRLINPSCDLVIHSSLTQVIIDLESVVSKDSLSTLMDSFFDRSRESIREIRLYGCIERGQSDIFAGIYEKYNWEVQKIYKDHIRIVPT
ncbi:hypothetical protein NEFER03_1974 [Nematocida sp. LUAm3]|nr:hypothetical protein NEFER03_1974 [Nematocida sp. LUAm3]KAI5176058.1 hypothetical protein NEFER02_1892 [Nematocida sp. LUAm2]KAI5177102.1 hypothetical protein NEFER01_0377 [Nematocida sp. LUAm1]